MPRRWNKSLFKASQRDGSVAVHGDHRASKGRDPYYSMKKSVKMDKRRIEEKRQKYFIKKVLKKLL